MRRLLLSVFGIAALSLAAPGAALARHHHHRHAKTNAHHARVHFEHVGPSGLTPQPGPKASEEPKTEPPATPSEGAGKIESFTEGVLTIVLNDGSKVVGKVTSATEIKCEKAATTASSTESDDNSAEGDKESEDSTTTRDSNVEGGDKSGSDDSGSGDDNAEPAASEPPCDSSALTPGTEVREAELKVGPSGTEFESIVLVR